MSGIPVEHCSKLLSDNLSCVINTALSSSKIKKKHLSCQTMKLSEAVAAGFVIFGHIRSELNVADILTKPFPPQLFHQLVNPFLFQHMAKHHQPEDITEILPEPGPYCHHVAAIAQRKSSHIDWEILLESTDMLQKLHAIHVRFLA